MPELAVKTRLPPVQKLVADDVIVAVGKALTVITFAALVALQPELMLTTTVYDPAAVAV